MPVSYNARSFLAQSQRRRLFGALAPVGRAVDFNQLVAGSNPARPTISKKVSSDPEGLFVGRRFSTDALRKGAGPVPRRDQASKLTA